jgi:hypothetical protein
VSPPLASVPERFHEERSEIAHAIAELGAPHRAESQTHLSRQGRGQRRQARPGRRRHSDHQRQTHHGPEPRNPYRDSNVRFYPLAGLNPEQRRAAEYGIRPGRAKDVGPLLVIAGAGSGKTRTVAHRVAHLLINGIDPHRILLLTFSRRAAEEMTRRYDGLFDGRSSSHQSCPDCIIGTRRYDFVGVGAGLG